MYRADFERFYIEMTKEQALSVSHQGDCYEDAEFLVAEIHEQLDIISPEDIKAELKEYGTWDEEQLSDHEENLIRIVWIAGGNIREEINMENNEL